MKDKRIALLGIDLAKSCFQLHGVDASGMVILNKMLSRNKLIQLTANLPKCTIVMEACSGANWYTRKFKGFGHEVKLIAPQFVRPFVKGNKNDQADAQAIVEAASRPSMHFVTPKEIWQQDIQALHNIRSRLVHNKTALMNQIRGILTEYGIVVVKGVSSLKTSLMGILQGALSRGDLSHLGIRMLQKLYSELLNLETEIKTYEKELKDMAKRSEECQRLQAIKGFGYLTVTGLIGAIGDPSQFKNGRQFSAWLGLVPKHTGTGGKNRVLGISKRGNTYLRCLLIHGARAYLRVVVSKATQNAPLDDLSCWINRLYQKTGWNRTCVALANKNARIAWAILNFKEEYNPEKTNKRLKQAA